MKKPSAGQASEIKLVNRLIDNAKKDERWNISLGYDFEFNGEAYEIMETAGREYPMVLDYLSIEEMKAAVRKIILTGTF